MKNDAPERIWAYEHCEQLTAAISPTWFPRWAEAHEYIRADHAQAEKEAAVAAAYEDAAQLVEQVRDERCERCGNPRHDHPYRHMFVSTGSPMRAAAAIRARGNTDRPHILPPDFQRAKD